MTFCFTLHSKSLSRIHIGNKPKTRTVKIRDTETEGMEQLSLSLSHTHTHTHTRTHTQSHRSMAINPLNNCSMYTLLQQCIWYLALPPLVSARTVLIYTITFTCTVEHVWSYCLSPLPSYAQNIGEKNKNKVLAYCSEVSTVEDDMIMYLAGLIPTTWQHILALRRSKAAIQNEWCAS